MAEVALSTGTSGTLGVANSVVPELSGWAVEGGGDADAVFEVVAGVAGVAEGVGEAAEAVAGAVLADSFLVIGIAAGGTIADADAVAEVVGEGATGGGRDGNAASDAVVVEA